MIATTPGTISFVIDISRQRFEELVAEALDEIPEPLAKAMDNVVVLVEDDPPERSLLGLYEGHMLTNRGTDYGIGMPLPDRIFIFRNPILRICRSERDVVREVAVTVVHEIAHHFGIEDDRLHELGWG